MTASVLPLRQTAAPASAPASARVVLVVDDYPAVLAWAARAFERAGWAVRTATDGREALEQFAAAAGAGQPVRLLVTDLELPGLDGETLVRALRAHAPQLPVIAMHAGESAAAAWRGPLPDRAAFFEKPVRAQALVATAAALDVPDVASDDAGRADGADAAEDRSPHEPTGWSAEKKA